MINLSLLFVLLLGLEIGSFANVCIYRWPRNASIRRPSRSHCPWCQAKIPWFDNIPIVSFFLLRRKCRQCRSPISWRYPLVEGGLAFLWAVVFVWLRDMEQMNPPTIAATLFVLFVMVVTTLTDLDWKIIPDEATYTLILVGIVVSPWNIFIEGTGWIERLARSVEGMVVGGGLLWTISALGRRILGKEVMGGGDIKLLAGFGAMWGWQAALLCLLIGSMLGTITALLGMAMHRLRRHQYIPFGPFLNAGGIAVLFFLIKMPRIVALFP